MGKITKNELDHYDILMKIMINKIGDIFTKYICDNMYSDNRAEKRCYLTEIELSIKFAIEDLLKFVKNNNEII